MAVAHAIWLCIAALANAAAAAQAEPLGVGHLDVDLARDERPPAGLQSAGDDSGAALSCSLAALVPLLICGAAGLAFCLLGRDSDDTGVAWRARAQGAADAASAGLALGVEAAIAAGTLPLLPYLGHGDPVLLYFVRPIVGAAAALLLPLALRDGRRRGRLVAASGLLLLGVSCVSLAVAASPAAAFAARVVGAAASACVIVPVFHTVMLESPADVACWRMGAALYGAVTGWAVGPWIAGALVAQWGAPLAMAIMAAACEATCLLYLATCVWIVEAPADVQLGHPLEGGLTSSSLFTVASKTLKDPRSCVLVAGVGLSAAVLSMHAAVVPAYLDGQGWSAGGADLAAAEGLAQAGLGLAVLITAACADSLGERWAACGMVVSTVLSIIGIRCIVKGHGSVQPLIAAIGILSSQGGVGGYLGLALPLLLRITCGPCMLPTAPAAAASSGALGVALLAGEGFGVALQRGLLPALGHERTVLAFAVLLAGHVCLMLAVPGWLRAGQGKKPALHWPQRHSASALA